MAGPNRSILSGGHLLAIRTTVPARLGIVARVDFAKHPKAEAEILAAFHRALQLQSAQKSSPSTRTVCDFFHGLEVAIRAAERDLVNLWPDLPGPQLLQLRGVLAELLEQNDDSLGSLIDAVEILSEALLGLDRQVTSAKAAFETVAAEKKFDQHQNSHLPDSFFPELQAILRNNELETRIGAKSLLVQLFIELTGKRPECPTAEMTYAKSVADQIRKIIKKQ